MLCRVPGRMMMYSILTCFLPSFPPPPSVLTPLKAVKLPNLVFFGFVGKLIVCDLRALPTPN